MNQCQDQAEYEDSHRGEQIGVGETHDQIRTECHGEGTFPTGSIGDVKAKGGVHQQSQHQSGSEQTEVAQELEVGQLGDVEVDAFRLPELIGAEALPEEQRLVMALVVIDGRSYRDTAEQLGIPIGSVMSRLARARASIDAQLRGVTGRAAKEQGKRS